MALIISPSNLKILVVTPTFLSNLPLVTLNRGRLVVGSVSCGYKVFKSYSQWKKTVEDMGYTVYTFKELTGNGIIEVSPDVYIFNGNIIRGRGLKQFCKTANLSLKGLSYDLHSGKSIREIFHSLEDYKKKEISSDITDHLGNVFKSKSAMLEHYGVSRDVFKSRLKRGDTLEQALRPVNSQKTFDYLGNEFPSLGAMLEYYNISYDTYYGRISKGYSLERTLTEGVNSDTSVCDHLGNLYNSKKDMAEYYGIPYRVFLVRLSRGWSLEDSLVTPKEFRNLLYDHKGNKYRSIQEMADAYGVSPNSVRYKLKKGFSLEEALTTPRKV